MYNINVIYYTYYYYILCFSFSTGVWNQPGIDSTADIFTFCENLERKCLQLGVKILLNTEVHELKKENNKIVGVLAGKANGKYHSVKLNIP